MLYDGHVNCGADILSEDTSDESDKYKYYEEIANDEDLQRSVGGKELGGDTIEPSQNSDDFTIKTWKTSLRLPTIRKLKRKWLGWRLNAQVSIP